MPAVARIGDPTFGCGSHGLPCCGHCFSGVWITGSPNTFAHNRNVVRVGDIGVHSCPHCGINIALGHSPDVITNNIPTHRFTDTVNECCGTGLTVSGDFTVILNG